MVINDNMTVTRRGFIGRLLAPLIAAVAAKYATPTSNSPELEFTYDRVRVPASSPQLDGEYTVTIEHLGPAIDYSYCPYVPYYRNTVIME